MIQNRKKITIVLLILEHIHSTHEEHLPTVRYGGLRGDACMATVYTAEHAYEIMDCAIAI